MTQDIAELIDYLQTLFYKANLKHYLIGANARDLNFLGTEELKGLRKTLDIDFAVRMQSIEEFNAMQQILLNTGRVTQKAQSDPIKFFVDDNEIDIIPFGPIENENREVRLANPKPFEIDVPGFEELLPYTKDFYVGNLRIKSIGLEAVVMLKFLAYRNNPRRSKDIEDINTIIKHYLSLNEEVYEDYSFLFNQFDYSKDNYQSLIGAWIIGNKIKGMLTNSPALALSIKDTIQKRPTEEWLLLEDGLSSSAP